MKPLPHTPLTWTGDSPINTAYKPYQMKLINGKKNKQTNKNYYSFIQQHKIKQNEIKYVMAINYTIK